MAVDFRDAAERHWGDAGHLSADARLANADHLLGLSAECALKAVMQSLGMPLRPDCSPVQREHRVHINRLWDEFISFAAGRGGVRYAAKMGNVVNPFGDWDASQRYDHRSCFTAPRVAQHRCAAQTTMTVLEDAILDGGVV